MSGWKAAFSGYVVVFVALAYGVPSPLHAQEAQEYIVQFQDGTGPAARGEAARAVGADVSVIFGAVSAAVVRVPNAAALEALRQNPAVVSIVPNRPVFAHQNGNAKGGKGKKGGGGGGQQGQTMPAGVARVGEPTAGSNGAGVGVAVLDTGVDLTHQDLTGTVDAFSAFGGTCQDDNGHGTHVAGTVGARDNGADVVGVAPGARLYCVKVLDNTGRGYDGTVMAGLDWVLTTPAIRVVNMSLGRPGWVGDNPVLRDLITLLDAAGVSVVASAGNNPSVEVSQQIPAAYPEVIAVASTTALDGSNRCRFLNSPIAADTASYFTADGGDVLVSAPGEDQENVNRGCLIKSIGILSTQLGGGTTRMSGTSMASPHVAGIAARHYQINPNYLSADVRNWIAIDADRKGSAPLDSPTASYSFDGVLEGIAQAPPVPLDP